MPKSEGQDSGGVGDFLDDVHEARRAIRDLLALLEVRGDGRLTSFVRRMVNITHPAALAAVNQENRLRPQLEELINAADAEGAVGQVAVEDVAALRALARRELADDRVAGELLRTLDREALRRRGALREIDSLLGRRRRASRGGEPLKGRGDHGE